MKNFKRKIVALLLSVTMIFSVVSPVMAYTKNDNLYLSSFSKVSGSSLNDTATVIQKVAAKVKGTIVSPSKVGDAWSFLGLVRSGVSFSGSSDFYNTYVNNIKSNLNNISSTTDYAKIIISVSGIKGVDVTNFGGKNLVNEMIKCYSNGYVTTPIYVLIALNTKNYSFDTSLNASIKSKEDLIKDILSSNKNDNGEYGGSGWTDMDSTYMALQALAPFYKDILANNSDLSKDTQDKVKDQVDKGIASIKNRMNSKGSVEGNDGHNANTTEQAIVAVNELGMNLNDFSNDGKNLYDGLMSYYLNDGFKYKPEESDINLMATQQGLYALASYYRSEQNLNSLYNMSSLDTPTFPSINVSIKLNKTSLVLAQAGNSYQLSKVVSPSNASVKYTSSNSKVASVNSAGRITAVAPGSATIAAVASYNGTSKKATCSVNVKLSKLGAVKAIGGNKYAKVYYSRVKGATRYYIYKKIGSRYVKIATTTKTSYIDRKVTPGKNYYYKVRAVNGNYASVYSSTVKGAVKVGIPTKVKLKSGKKKVTITFKKVKYAKKYEIYKKSGKKYKKIATVKGGKYTDKKVKKGKKYIYKVRAVKDSTNKSSFTKAKKCSKVK